MNLQRTDMLQTCPALTRRRVAHLENTVRSLASGQNQIQMALQQILSMLPQNNAFSTTPSSVPSFLSQQGDIGVSTANIFQTSVSPPDIFGAGSGSNTSPHNMSMYPPPIPHSPQNTASGRRNDRSRSNRTNRDQEFPKLPGFAPPVSANHAPAAHARLTGSEHTASSPSRQPLHHHPDHAGRPCHRMTRRSQTRPYRRIR